jgi:hypothetical protein
MSLISYISFPRKLNAFRVSDIAGREEEFGIDYDISDCASNLYLFPDFPLKESHIVIKDKKTAIFKDCFKNPFIYEFYIEIPLDFDIRRSEIVFQCSDDEVKQRELRQLEDKENLLYNQSLYDFLLRNLRVGEFAEIYTAWHDHVNYNFETPTSECVINLEDIFNPPMSVETLAIEKRYKLTVYRSVEGTAPRHILNV